MDKTKLCCENMTITDPEVVRGLRANTLIIDEGLRTVGVKAEDVEVKTFSNFLIELINFAVANECEVDIGISRFIEGVRIIFRKRRLSTSLFISKNELEMCPGKVYNDVMIRFKSYLHYYKTMQEEWDG